MTNLELEELIYEFGSVMYQIGRAETNEKIGMKEYDKLLNQKQKLKDKFDAFFVVGKKTPKLNSSHSNHQKLPL